MNDQKPDEKTGRWSAVRQHLTTWQKPALLALIKDLYQAGAANRDFINARCGGEQGGATLESYKKRVIEPFYPARGEPKLRFGDARKAMREYRKATGHISGVIELLLTYSEAGAQFTTDFGDIDERFYNSLCSALDELADLVQSEGEEAWEPIAERMEKLAAQVEGIGWGYGDYVNEVVAELEAFFGT